ncbi:MAG: ATP-binding protein, partial [Acidobacteriota bacterium]
MPKSISASGTAIPRPKVFESEVDTEVVELDAEAAVLKKHRRLVRLNTVRIPLLRFLGFGLLTAAAYAYNLQLGDPADNRLLPLYGLAVLAYCTLSWPILRASYRPGAAVDTGLVFLTLDLLLQIWAVYLTGADNSWLIVLLLFRTADQANTGFRRALFFALVSPLCYLGMLAYLVLGDGQAINWSAELTKVVLLFVGTLYLAVSSMGQDQRRQRTATAIRMARNLVRRLEVQSEELDEARRRAEVANEAKGQFLTNVSHELRTPMNAILGLSELVLSHSGLPPAVRSHLDMLRDSAVEQMTVIDGVLDFAQLEAEELDLAPVDLDARGPVAEVMRRLAPRAAAKGLELVEGLDRPVPQVRADPVRLRQVLLHLAGNAVKFTDQGRVTVRGGVDSGGMVRFEIEDTGQGFPVDAASLFEPFTQADSSLTRRFGGTGIGLPLSQRLVHGMGGDLGVERAPGGGTVVWFTLPAVGSGCYAALSGGPVTVGHAGPPRVL